MKKKYLPLILLSFVFVVIAFVFFKKESTQRIVVNGIGNFNPVPSNGKNYLLFYPADLRVSQKNTIVKEVTNQGDIVREYEIKDRDIRRMSFHQKPNDINKLYISFFGEATIDNYYFTYNIKEKKFTKVNLNYFEHKVGVDHIIHYGDDILFQTLVSHKTGEQNVNLENNEFNVSISDYSIKKNFETEYGHVPKWAPLLEFNNKIIYGTSGQVNEKNVYENSGIGVIDLENQTVEYKLPVDTIDLTPIYSTKNHAYILSDSGKIFVYDKNFHYKEYSPFEGISNQATIYKEERGPLFIDSNQALFSINSNDQGSMLGIMTFKPKPNFRPIKKDYLKTDSHYRFLYQDIERKEIYLLKINEEKESLLVIDNHAFNLKAEIPVENSHLIDFVVKN